MWLSEGNTKREKNIGIAATYFNGRISFLKFIYVDLEMYLYTYVYIAYQGFTFKPPLERQEKLHEKKTQQPVQEFVIKTLGYSTQFGIVQVQQ